MKSLNHIFMRIGKDLKKHWVVIGLIFLVYQLLKIWFSSICPSVRWLGLPCPGCGMTRALGCVGRGEFSRAWDMNPMIYPVILYCAYLAVNRYVLGRKIKGFMTQIVILCLCMALLFVIRMKLYFPDRIPYVYNSSNVLSDIIPDYGRLMSGIIQTIRKARL